MQPNIIRTGICATLSAAVVVSLSGLVPVTAHAAPEPATSDQLAGKTIFLDPGHQGSGHTEDLNRPVDNGRGGTKACQTTGMTSLNGIPEHTINWDVAQLVKASLQALGAQVVLSRADDVGWGGCVDDRARAANESGADVAVSIHADSAGPDQHGFHLIVPELPIPDPVADQAQSGGGRVAAAAVRDAYLAAGFSPANYAGVTGGLQTRADVAGPALTQVPLVFVEMGNGANADDAARLETREGQLEHAVAIATGVVGFLLNKPIPASAPARVPARAPIAEPAEVPARTAPGAGSRNTAPETPAEPAPSTPKKRGTTPQTETTPQESEFDLSVLGGPITAVMTLLMPLAEALGMDESTIPGQLINLVYTLVGLVFGPV
ncbi:N-acetylmuramoyl-L-alanine amidase [Nocardia lasii]|uniref:N-acetylmuramoyl-L-alanine amidase n=1 Tax=Nocardia lasii TaxID=1616107 RepID=A0ABW1JQB3_9NOCA